MIIAFLLVLVSAISVQGIAFDQAKNCETIAECLQKAVEADNNLIAENMKLAQDNLALKKKIGEKGGQIPTTNNENRFVVSCWDLTLS